MSASPIWPAPINPIRSDIVFRGGFFPLLPELPPPSAGAAAAAAAAAAPLSELLDRPVHCCLERLRGVLADRLAPGCLVAPCRPAAAAAAAVRCSPRLAAESHLLPASAAAQALRAASCDIGRRDKVTQG